MQQIKFVPVSKEDTEPPKYILAKTDFAKHAHIQPINIAQNIKYGKNITSSLYKILCLQQKSILS